MYQALPDVTYHDIFEMDPSLPPLAGKKSWHKIPKGHPKEADLVEDYRKKLSVALSQEQLVKQTSELGLFDSSEQLDKLIEEKKRHEAKSKSVHDLTPEEREKIIFSRPTSRQKKH